MLLLDDDIEAFLGRLATVHLMGKIGGMEAFCEDVETILFLHPAGETVVVDLVGVAEQVYAIALLEAQKQLDAFAWDVDQYGVDDIVDLAVAQLGEPGHTTYVVAVLLDSDKPFFEEVHLVGLEILAVELAQMGDAAAGNGLNDILITDVVDHASKVEYDVLDSIHDKLENELFY